MPVRSRNGVNYIYLETVTFSQCSEDTYVAGALAAKPVIVAYQQLLHAEAAPEDELDEIFRGIRGELGGERHHSQVVDAGLGQDFLLLIVGREQERRRCRIHDLEWVRLERHEDARDFQMARASYESLHYIPMSTVNAVEGPDGDDGCRDVRRES